MPPTTPATPTTTRPTAIHQRRPDASLGTILSQAGLSAPVAIGGDVIPARQATLGVLEAAQGQALIGYAATTFDLDDSPANNGGVFEEAGDFGLVRTDLLTVDGEYGFRARATYGTGCTATRKYVWGLHVEVGIDPDHTGISFNVKGSRAEGQRLGTITITPGDKFGNKLGPGRSDGILVSGVPGTTITGPIVDNGVGTYTIPVSWGSGSEPGVVLGQPGRSPVVVAPKLTGGHCRVRWWWLVLMILLALLVGLLVGYLLGH